jgi:hypothetical protein
MPDAAGERSRRPIRADLPADLHALLAEMERLADTSGQSFPKILDKIFEAGGGRHRPSRVTAWRAGTAFPPEPAARHWAGVCGGDTVRMMTLHAAAEIAYRRWRSSTRDETSETLADTGTPDTADGTHVLSATEPQPAESSTHPAATAAGPTHPEDADSTGDGNGAARPGPPPRTAAAGGRQWWRKRPAAAAVTVLVIVAGFAGWRMWPHAGGPADANTSAENRPCSWWWDGASRQPPEPAAGPRRPAALMYKVPSGPGSGDIAILPTGSLVQPFRATTNGLDAAAAIIGIDPKRSHRDQPHDVHFEVLQHRDGEPARLLGTANAQVTLDNDNKDVTGVFDPPVRLETGQLYALRVVNDSTETIGVYVNAPAGEARRVPYPAYACADGEVEPFDPAGKVLSGYISGTTF